MMEDTEELMKGMTKGEKLKGTITNMAYLMVGLVIALVLVWTVVAGLLYQPYYFFVTLTFIGMSYLSYKFSWLHFTSPRPSPQGSWNKNIGLHPPKDAKINVMYEDGHVDWNIHRSDVKDWSLICVRPVSFWIYKP